MAPASPCAPPNGPNPLINRLPKYRGSAPVRAGGKETCVFELAEIHLCDRCHAAAGVDFLDYYWLCVRCAEAYATQIAKERWRR
jgi:hypothetical protein